LSANITLFGAPTGLRLASNGSVAVVLFDGVEGADGYEFLISPSEASWLPQRDVDRGDGVVPNPLLRFEGLTLGVPVEVFARARVGGVLGPAGGPLRVVPELLGAPVVEAQSVLGDVMFVATPVQGGFELMFEVEVVNSGEASLSNLWVRALLLPDMVVGLTLSVDRGAMYSFSPLDNQWYWEGVELLPGESARIAVVALMEAPSP
jgi:hypothetical protein